MQCEPATPLMPQEVPKTRVLTRAPTSARRHHRQAGAVRGRMTRWLLIATTGALLSGLAPPCGARLKLIGITDDAGRAAAPLEFAQAPKAQPAPVIPPVPQL